MKKITLIVCALATAVASFAGVQNGQKRIVKDENVSFRVMQEQFNPAAQKVVAAGLDTLSVPYIAYNVEAYQVGKPADGLSYSYYQQGWVTPFVDTILFVNSKNMASTWLVDGVEVASNSLYYLQPAGFGEHSMPVMKTAKNDTAVFLDYQVAGLTVADWHNDGYTQFYTATNVAPASIYSITKCGMYTEDARESQYGQDWYQVGAGSIGSYAYGSQLTNPWDGGYFDTILVPFFQAEGESMFINDITLAVYSDDALFPAEEDHIRLSIYPMDKQGTIDWENPIARAIANAENFTPYSASYQNLGLLEFDFLEEDPITGAATPAPISVAGNFIVAFDQFNDGTANVGFFSDYYKANGQTYLVGRDSDTGERYITGLWTRMHNILMSIDVLFPTFNAPKSIDFAQGETEKTINVPSNIWDEDMEIEADEWIDVKIVTDYQTFIEEGEEYYEHKFNNQLTIKLEASDEARRGKITLSGLGAEFEIVVSQNDAAQGINTVKAVNDNKMYNVLGVEVGEDYKGVVIRNGQKLIR